MKREVLYRAEQFHLYERERFKSYRLFSYGDFYDEARHQFGALRLLNHDIQMGKRRFSQQYHKDVEVIIIALAGVLEYTDSKSNRCIIKENEVIVINAGSGICYAINNANFNKEARYLKLWILPRTAGLTPLHQVGKIDSEMLDNRFEYIITPDTSALDALMIRQDAWVAGCQLDPKSKITYTKKNAHNGIFIQVCYGTVNVHGHQITQGDCIAYGDKKSVTLESVTASKILLIEVPMTVTLYDTYDPIIVPPKM